MTDIYDDLHVVRAALNTAGIEDFTTAIQAHDRVEEKVKSMRQELIRLREVHRTVNDFRKLMQEGMK